jgi:OPA family glycerol-3-phosphate transporter-like MFS transporter/OPA family sugar phosphate sensor protein UhpC-like MFS transporter
VAMPLLERDLGITKTDLGKFLTAHSILYGISKFVNGYVADRSNARTFLAFGLMASALLNFGFGFVNTVTAMGILWCLNGYFQGMGFPPCARVLSHWFAPPERGTMWGIWNASHMVGAAVILVWAGYLGKNYGYKAIFFAPGAVAVVMAVLILIYLRDTPASVGLGDVEEYYHGEVAEELEAKPEVGSEPKSGEPESEEEFRLFLRRRVFGNLYVWLICLANFCVYTVRYGFLDWAPTFLNQVKNYQLDHAGWMTAGFEIAGLVGSLIAGIITDRYFRTKRAPICVVYMIGTALAILALWKLPAGSFVYDAGVLLAVGFMVYGPQFLVGVMIADIVTKRAAATAIGLTGLFGYGSSILYGYGLGKIVDTYGWDAGFLMLAGIAVLGAFFFALCWNAGAEE